MAEHQYTFSKEERLRHHKLISLLFKKGVSFHAGPVNLVWLDYAVAGTKPAQGLFAVPKRNFKHANQRNLLRRRMKEVYRLLKPGFYNHLEKYAKHGIFAFVYVGKEAVDYNIIQDKINLLLQRLMETHEKAIR